MIDRPHTEKTGTEPNASNMSEISSKTTEIICCVFAFGSLRIKNIFIKREKNTFISLFD